MSDRTFVSNAAGWMISVPVDLHSRGIAVCDKPRPPVQDTARQRNGARGVTTAAHHVSARFRPKFFATALPQRTGDDGSQVRSAGERRSRSRRKVCKASTTKLIFDPLAIFRLPPPPPSR